METSSHINPLGTQSIWKLIARMGIPAVISNLVGALYSMVDQMFIGHKLGYLGNAATSVSFPMTTAVYALTLLLGIGISANFNLAQGKGETEYSGRIACTGISCVFIAGTALAILFYVFMKPLLLWFGAGPDIFDYAYSYASILCLGFPMYIMSVVAPYLIRTDGSPNYCLVGTMTGAIVNVVLDYIFIFKFEWGMAGAAWATVIGQFIAGAILLGYFRRFKVAPLKKEFFIPNLSIIRSIGALGMAHGSNQLSMALTQVVMNNTLAFYGAQSIYGRDVPLACYGIIAKIHLCLMAILIGISQGLQPVVGFNYGAKQFGRVKETFIKAATAATVVAFIAFLCFQFFPRQIMGMFGGGTDEYFIFAEKYFKTYMFFTFLYGFENVTTNFLTSMGKAKLSMFSSLTRQLLFLIPMIILLPRIFGIEGALYAGPISDVLGICLSITIIVTQMRQLTRLEKEHSASSLA